MSRSGTPRKKAAAPKRAAPPRALEPDAVVMDIGLVGMSGIEATRRLLAANPGIKLLALSTFADRRMVQQMLEAGARGYVVKSTGSEELLLGIRASA